jgi:predicted RNase H-like HicB family nuclease
MKKAYPITITLDGEFYMVYVPDFELNTQGESIAEAMEMARDVIGMAGCYKQDEGQDIPEPSKLEDVRPEACAVLTLVDVDFDEYRRKHDNRTVRKNLTIPSWLNEEAEAAGIAFSDVLKKALKQELNITDR